MCTRTRLRNLVRELDPIVSGNSAFGMGFAHAVIHAAPPVTAGCQRCPCYTYHTGTLLPSCAAFSLAAYLSPRPSLLYYLCGDVSVRVHPKDESRVELVLPACCWLSGFEISRSFLHALVVMRRELCLDHAATHAVEPESDPLHYDQAYESAAAAKTVSLATTACGTVAWRAQR